MSLLDAARAVRENAYAPYSKFKVGAALRTEAGEVFVGCNVENAAYPEGTCAEAGAIAAMAAAGARRIAEVAVIADAPEPVPPCGGCRQKIAEFAAPDVVVTLATTDGAEHRMTVGDLLPGAFGARAYGEGLIAMDARGIIAKLRRGEALGREELVWFAEGLADGGVGDAQAGAFSMAVCLNGLSEEERVGLTLAMRDSGTVLSWDLPGPAIDKHSTGGIGDCVSLLLAPALAALGTYVPMISGRGLGHTGGTLDKLESIPGLKTEVDEARFRAIVEEAGAAIVSASDRIAPADKRLYAIRDITATVESIDLITASILAKKLAGGLDALVLDVKVGSGAFMTTMDDAAALAESLVATANGAGCATTALITDMNQPVCSAAGNALEVMEVMHALTDRDIESTLCDLTADLGGELLRLAGMADDRREGAGMIFEAITSGAAAERFGRMVRAMGGPGDFVEHWRDRLPAAPVVLDVVAERRGFVTEIDGRALGEAVVRLGGGRLVAGQRIDPSVGLSELMALGDELAQGDRIAQVHAASEADAAAAARAVAAAYTIGVDFPELPPVTYRSVC